MPKVYKINAVDASKLYEFFQQGSKQGRRVWDRGEYPFGEDLVSLDVGVVAFESKKNNEMRYGILGNLVAEGGFATVFDVDYTLTNSHNQIRFKSGQYKNKPRLVKTMNIEPKNGMTLELIQNEYELSPPYLHMKKPTFQNNDAFLVMRKMRGECLIDMLGDIPLTIKERIEISIALIQELMTIHANQILHRDIKPDNIIVNRETTPISVRYIDFGLSVRQTALDGHHAGSCHYAAPEIFDPRIGAQSVASDIFSLGRTLARIWGIDEYSYLGNGVINNLNLNIFTFKNSDFFKDIDLDDDDARNTIRFIIRRMLRQDPVTRMSLLVALSAFNDLSIRLFPPKIAVEPEPLPIASSSGVVDKPNWFAKKWHKLTQWFKTKRVVEVCPIQSSPDKSMEYIGDCSTARTLSGLSTSSQNREINHEHTQDENDSRSQWAVDLVTQSDNSSANLAEEDFNACLSISVNRL